ncbi:MAG TPA: Spy/CpxP family protein refolding chaperone [Stellaceae bacterium]|nr:Spy/CpxP family protein refolding chaperone [Stellaceae bacterium]
MLQRKKFASLALILALTAVPAIAVRAQQQPSPQQPSQTWWMGPGMMGTYGMGPGMMGRWMMGAGGSLQAMCNAMTGHIEGRLAYINAELKITEAQEPLWKAYEAAARDNGNTMLAHCTAMMGQRGTSTASLPDRLDQHEQLMAAQLEAVRAMNKALKPLYGVLSDAQKKTADELFWGPMGMM